MSEESKHVRNNQQGGFEHQDLAARGVYSFLVWLSVVTVVILFILVGLYRYLNGYEESHQPAQNPLVQKTEADTRTVTPDDARKFSEPRLETDERRQLNEERWSEEEVLNSYGWVDQKAGIVHVPIERAMQLVAQRGLPVRASVGKQPAAANSILPAARH